jgi:hypothetical protein
VRRLVTWVVVSLGIAALVRRLRRRSRPQEGPPDDGAEAPAESDADDPAEGLRRKLAESRVEDEPDAPSAPAATVEERRAEVHGQGRATLGEMGLDDTDEPGR